MSQPEHSSAAGLSTALLGPYVHPPPPLVALAGDVVRPFFVDPLAPYTPGAEPPIAEEVEEPKVEEPGATAPWVTTRQGCRAHMHPSHMRKDGNVGLSKCEAPSCCLRSLHSVQS